MEKNTLRKLVGQGLCALKAGAEVAEEACTEIQNDASNSQLKEVLERGHKTSKTWQTRVDRAVKEVGEESEHENLVFESLYQASKKMRQESPDELTRDLGIVASAQMALHHWIAAFGTLKCYAASAGLTQTEKEMQTSLEEAKKADHEYSQLASHILESKAQQAA